MNGLQILYLTEYDDSHEDWVDRIQKLMRGLICLESNYDLSGGPQKIPRRKIHVLEHICILNVIKNIIKLICYHYYKRSKNCSILKGKVLN